MALGWLQFRFGWGRSVFIMAIIYCFGGELTLDCDLCMDFVLHHWGRGAEFTFNTNSNAAYHDKTG